MAWLSENEPHVCDWCLENIEDEPVVEIFDGMTYEFDGMPCYTSFALMWLKKKEAADEQPKG